VIRYHDSVKPLLLSLAPIRPHYRNPVSVDPDQVNALIDRLGVYWPILVSSRTGEIIHDLGLYEALLSRGETHGPILFVDDDNDEETLAALTAHYAIIREAWLDPGIEVPNLKELAETDWGLLGTGYDDSIFERRLAEMNEIIDGLETTPTIECPHCHATIEIDRVR
jgi:hypothetical protein